MTRLAMALCLACLPGLAAAQDFSGTWQLDGCGQDTMQTRIVIAGGQIDFLETRCSLSNPVAVRNMGDATLYDASCQGEGDEWGYRALLMRSEDGSLIFLREGRAFTYARCD